MNTQNNFTDPDAFYDELCALHTDLDEKGSADLNARLVLILSNQIGDMTILRECFQLASRTGAVAAG